MEKIMVRLEKITPANVWDIINLKISESQKGFVSANQRSIIEAYAIVNIGGHAFPFGIYDGDIAVGFMMIGFDVDDYWENPPAIAPGNYNLWRFMIDEKYQNRGYGKAAMKLALEFVRSFPCGRAEYFWTSYVPKNEAAKKLYASFGFEENGETDCDEIITVLKI